MPGYIVGETGLLFDPVTKLVVGALDLLGREQMISGFDATASNLPASALGTVQQATLNLINNLPIVNATRANTNKWRAARGKVQAGVANARVLCCGNSITSGLGATGNAMLSNARSKSYPTQLAQIMSSLGLYSSWQSWTGGTGEVDIAGNDSRITLGSWTNSGLGVIGSNCMVRTAVGGTPMSFTPLTPVDRVQCLLIRSGAGHVEISNDGGALVGVANAADGTGTHNITAPLTLTGGLGIKVINATLQAASVTTFMAGLIAYNNAIKEVSVINAGWVGATVDALDDAWSYNDGILALAPDLTLLAFTRNEITSNMNALGIAQYKPLYRKPIVNALISGDVILVIEPLGTVTPAAALPYLNQVYELAAEFNVPVIDFNHLWSDYASTTTWYVDGTHPAGFAYADMARQVANVLVRL